MVQAALSRRCRPIPTTSRVIVTSSITGPPGHRVIRVDRLRRGKAGQLGFIRSAALELARSGITINAILPGNIATEGLDGMGPDYLRSMEAAIPMRHLGTVADIATRCCFRHRRGGLYHRPDAGDRPAGRSSRSPWRLWGDGPDGRGGSAAAARPDPSGALRPGDRLGTEPGTCRPAVGHPLDAAPGACRAGAGRTVRRCPAGPPHLRRGHQGGPGFVGDPACRVPAAAGLHGRHPGADRPARGQRARCWPAPASPERQRTAGRTGSRRRPGPARSRALHSRSGFSAPLPVLSDRRPVVDQRRG